ncbi:MAG: hypothetical protein FWD44_08630 [Oscillospiraceae bacterium]|nr:hypothetical protein [Oscillospiraceae bacterium]
MKITINFITNSSSTNYVIAYKSQPSVDNETIKKYPFLTNYYNLLKHVLITEESWHNTTEGEIISSVDDLNGYFLSYYGCGEEKSIKEIIDQYGYSQDEYDNYKKCLEDGFNLLFKSIDNIDEINGEILDSLAKDNKDFIILNKYES